MKCVACWLASDGANYTEAQFLFGGQSLCGDHMTKVYKVLEEVAEQSPDVTPH